MYCNMKTTKKYVKNLGHKTLRIMVSLKKEITKTVYAALGWATKINKHKEIHYFTKNFHDRIFQMAWWKNMLDSSYLPPSQSFKKIIKQDKII